MEGNENQPSNSKLGELLATLRKQKDLSYRDLEKLTGITAAYINKMENGKRINPSYSIINKLAKALEVNEQIFLSAVVEDDKPRSAIENKKKNISTLFTEIILSSSFKISNIEASFEVKQALIDLFTKIDSSILDSNRQIDKEYLEAIDNISKKLKETS